MHATISYNRRTCYKTHEAAAALASKLAADDPDTDYRVAQNNYGFYVAIFEDGEQVFSL